MFKRIIIFFAVGICTALCADDFIRNGVIFAYPDWKMKALSFSYDDAHVADRQLVEIFNRYDMKATFHIPYAWLTTKSQNRISQNEAW